MLQSRLAAVMPLGYDNSLLSPLSPQWVRLPGRAKISEEETIGVTGTRTAKNRASSPSKPPMLGFSCCAHVLVARGKAGAQQGTVRPDVRSSSTALSHPKPKCQGGHQSGLSTGLFHFKSQQFVLSRVRHSHQKLSPIHEEVYHCAFGPLQRLHCPESNPLPLHPSDMQDPSEMWLQI